ncbi:MAG: GNAT family N-acetyltransferase [Lachnospiraceae bacterium]|nr:GNAT family N-acetyltransferase [Lachnospiraceae bacterium]
MKTVILSINKLNEDDSVEGFLEHTKLNVSHSISDRTDEAFLVTDNRQTADIALKLGIGFAVYINGENDPSDFKEALYCIDNISTMTDDALVKMYERFEGIPWTILETDRCIIREITVEDADRLYEIYSDKDVTRYIENLYENREDEINHIIKYITHQYRFYEYGMWIVVSKETGSVIGRAGIFDRDNQDTTELGFMFEKASWGKGIAKEVLMAIIGYAKEEHGIERLYAHVVSENVNSKKLLEKLGFKYVSEVKVDDNLFERYEYNS